MDCRDPSMKLKLENLLGWMVSSFTPPQASQNHGYGYYQQQEPASSPVMTCLDVSMESYISGRGEQFDAFIADWEEKMEAKLNAEIESIVKQRSYWCQGQHKIHTLDYRDHASILQHYEWAHEKVTSFVGREDLVQQGLELVLRENRGTDKKPAQRVNFEGVCMCVVGVSGSG